VRFSASDLSTFALERPTLGFADETPIERLIEVAVEANDGATDDPIDDESGDGSDIEVVESFDPIVFDEPEEAPTAYDPYAAFLRALEAIAVAAGHAHVASRLEPTLAIDPMARAWRAMLRGESDDFPGTAPLDEWAADTLARLMGAPSRAAQLRRELRARGVAAFGIVEAA
jgi:hypothetical protein